MRKLSYLLVMPLLSAFLLTSCSDDNEDEGDNEQAAPTVVTEVNMSAISDAPQFVQIGAYIKYQVYTIVRYIDLDKKPYTENVTLQFPETIDAESLKSVKTFPGSQEYSDEETRISDYVIFQGYDASGQIDSEHVLTCIFSDSKSRGWVYYMYADRDCTVTGSEQAGSSQHKVDLILKKGWNRIISSTDAATTDITVVRTGALPKEAKWYCRW